MYDTGVIPAAGAGLRLHPYTGNTAKPLLEIGGKSLLQRNLEIMRDQLGVRRVIIIIGHLGEQIQSAFGDGSDIGLQLEYVECHHVEAGLAHGLYQIRDRVDGPFPVILGDELYLNTSHERFRQPPAENYTALCGIKITGDTTLIKRNYAVEIEDSQITALTEKPRLVTNNFLGCGSYVFTPQIFEFIERTPASERSGRVELTDAIDLMARERGGVHAVTLTGGYSNINTPTDYRGATYLYRKTHFHEYRTSLVIPAYEEAASIGHVLEEFYGLVDEIVVADNKSIDRTAEIARAHGARVISRGFAGYGDALKVAMDEARGDILILVEADASFSPDDLPKILEYLKDADMVIGTRTTRQMIEQGANMDFFLRWGNVLAAKVLQLLWIGQEPRFTDLGCTYRGIWKDAYAGIRERLHETGPAFSPEMMVEMLRTNGKVIEIPVTYRPRIGGVSKHSRGFTGILRTGTQMLWLIFRRRIGLR